MPPLLPQDAEPGVVINPAPPRLAQVNAILNGRSQSHYSGEYRGTLSLKCAFGGQAIYEAMGGRFAVSDAAYLLLNNQQTYALTIESAATVETFCLFFRPDFAERTLYSLVTPADGLLDDPGGLSRQPVLFVEKLYAHGPLVTPLIRALHFAVKNESATAGWFEERFHLVLERLLCEHRSLYREIDALPALRAATRVELYRRLHRAKDFMDASLDQSVSLGDVAEVAWLSPHHFLRLFKQVFNVTPHQYLTRQRLEKARRLLLATEMPITQIGLEAGIASHSAFSRLFRQHHGVSPEAYRREKGALSPK